MSIQYKHLNSRKEFRLQFEEYSEEILNEPSSYSQGVEKNMFNYLENLKINESCFSMKTIKYIFKYISTESLFSHTLIIDQTLQILIAKCDKKAFI